MSQRLPAITPELLLRAYALGVFPMAEDADDPNIYWVEPERRGIIPLQGLHVGSRLTRTVRSGRFSVEVDRDFDAVIDGCASIGDGKRQRTWISERIKHLYRQLHARGNCHSVEAYLDGVLAGGLYGVALGGAFFGESMFSLARDASKVALVHLVALLRRGGYRLLDTQFVTPHLASLGAIELDRTEYLARLQTAMAQKPSPTAWPRGLALDGAAALASLD